MFDLRLTNIYQQKENAQKLIKAILDNPGSCDNVWLCSLYGFPPYKSVQDAVEHMKEVKKMYCDAGISVSLQISNTLGHSAGHMNSYDYSGLIFENTPVERMVGEYGEVSDGCYCPRGEFFRNYIYETTKKYAEIEPLYVWVDDDLRIYNHAPVNHGCFCENCVEAFNKKHNTNYTRESIVHEINRGDVRVREAYIEHNREAIAGLTSTIARAVHEVSPNSRMAYQSSRTNSFLGADFDCIFRPMYEESGKKPVGYRPGGGFYEDSSPRGMIQKALHLDCAIACVPDYVEDICPEVESLPNVFFGKSFEGNAKEATLYLAYGCNSLSFAAVNGKDEPIEYEDRLLSQFSKYSGFWKKLISHNKGSKCGGVGLYISPESYKRKIGENEKDFAWDNIRFLYDRLELVSIGLPVTNNYNNCPVILLYPEACPSLTETDVKYLTSMPVICDGEALSILYEMGYGKYFGADARKADHRSLKERFTKHPINGDNAGGAWRASMFHHGGTNPAYIISDKDGKTEAFGEGFDLLSAEEYGCVNAVVNTYDDNGIRAAKWAVFGYSLYVPVTCSAKRDQIINAADYICNNSLPAKLLSHEQAAVIPRVNKDGKTVSVSIQSITIGESDKLSVLIRNPVGEKFSYMSGRKQHTAVSYKKTEDGYIVELPRIDPYELITVFCE
ncbi:MAG: hypothetical protein IKV97_03595 [Clostridia bacterium]|nr:hypothetical protein [Clostridia bacterium]